MWDNLYMSNLKKKTVSLTFWIWHLIFSKIGLKKAVFVKLQVCILPHCDKSGSYVIYIDVQDPEFKGLNTPFIHCARNLLHSLFTSEASSFVWRAFNVVLQGWFCLCTSGVCLLTLHLCFMCNCTWYTEKNTQIQYWNIF